MKAKKVFENIDFKRGQDPRASLAIGMDRFVKDINCNDWIVFYGTSGEISSAITDEGVLEYLKDFKLNKEEQERFLWLWNLYRTGVIEVGKFFDWKEEKEAENYINKNAKGRYVYNPAHGSDGWLITFSKIYFPSSENCRLEDESKTSI